MSEDHNSNFKQTPVGQIPINWDIDRVKQVGKVQTGSTPSTRDSSNYGGPFCFVTPADMGSAKYIRRTERTLSAKGFQSSRKLPAGAILFACIGSTIGKVGIASTVLTCNQQINSIICDDKHDSEYIYYELERRSRRIRLLAGEQAVPIINKSTFENIFLASPPLAEQRAIASILSTWDTAIETLASLIHHKDLRRKALMQQLLSGKKRLPGFKEPWTGRRLGDFFDERTETGRADLPLLSITGDRGVVPQTETDKRDNSTEDKSDYKRIAVGDIGYNTMRMWQGRSALSFHEGIVSPAYTIAIPRKNADGPFFAYYFKWPPVVHLFFRNSQGLVKDTLNCKFPQFASIHVRVPEKDEQACIASVLSECDREINLLEMKMALLQTEKRGLMQKLLTGQIRVKGGK